MNDAVFVLDAVAKAYTQAKAKLEVLRGVDLSVRAGELVALVGPSGAGKSTLLHVAGLLDRPDSGQVTIGGVACAGLDDEGRTRMRRGNIGFVYQYHHLLAEFSALENVVIPQRIAGAAPGDARRRAEDLLDRLGLAGRLTHRPGQLSGGEQQRVALARAVANRPAVLLADEPTGNLDPDTAEEVFALLLDLARGDRMAAIVATHNPSLAARLDRTVRLHHGTLVPA